MATPYHLTTSRNGIPVRLTEERWVHIVTEHPEVSEKRENLPTGIDFGLLQVLETVRSPDRIFLGNDGELLATREVKPGKWLVVVYRESSRDIGTTTYEDLLAESFIITAYLTKRIRSLERRQEI